MSNYLEFQHFLAELMIIFCFSVSIVLISFIILKKRLDKIVTKAELDNQNSLQILSEVKSEDIECDIEKVFTELDENNIDLSCNIKIDRGVDGVN